MIKRHHFSEKFAWGCICSARAYAAARRFNNNNAKDPQAEYFLADMMRYCAQAAVKHARINANLNITS